MLSVNSWTFVAVRPEQKAMELGKVVCATDVIRGNSYNSCVTFLFLFNEHFIYKKEIPNLG